MMDWYSLDTAPVLLVYVGITADDIIWYILLQRVLGTFCNPVLKYDISSQ